MLLFVEHSELINHVTFLSSVVMLCGALAFLCLLFTPAPYGRYHGLRLFSIFGTVPGRLGWVLMESPNLFVPAAIALTGSSAILTKPVNFALLMMYILHYVYR